MTRRQAATVLAATVALLALLDLLLYVLYRGERNAVAAALDDRLAALGRTAAKVLASPGADAPSLLAALTGENDLEDAYLLDADLAVRAGARTPAGGRVNLLRLDLPRVRAAAAGRASVAAGYRVDDVTIRSGVFPAGGGRVLVLEAGAGYLAPVSRLAYIFGVAGALSVLLAALLATGLWLAVRALERSRLAHGRAERLAAVGQMAAMVAHEVRNPLGIVRGHVELLRERLAPEAAARERERLDDVLLEVDRLGRLTDEFLTLARDAPLELAEVDLAALAAEIGDAVRRHPAAAAATITVRGDDPVVVRGDGARLRQALLNLILNAVQAGGDGVNVTVTAARAPREGRLVVTDDGPGVPAELRASLFEPFTSARPGGSGLGLAIAQRTAERHGGKLSLAPEGPGATFILSLPERGPPGWRAS